MTNNNKQGDPSTQGSGHTTGQQGSPHGGKEGKQGSNDNAGNSRDANEPDNKTARKNEGAGK